jgi:hypothetical protein
VTPSKKAIEVNALERFDGLIGRIS